MKYEGQRSRRRHTIWPRDWSSDVCSSDLNGAVAAIVEKVDRTINIPQYVVNDSRIALAQLGASFYDYPSEKMTVIGVTATSGKTTTTYMIEDRKSVV